ncbi:hypothetical protein GIB67_014528 [Kingdonia uniflora]|uniref:N(6)-L-threonylcarbamoyladenine synthase n=1 Tax=Kingdonia uniflora TaxID=39325 RepID=A0A7J7P505_9MAGN|nr:hypothetical protein GIB67_014528 [Kingdonia uniflora]
MTPSIDLSENDRETNNANKMPRFIPMFSSTFSRLNLLLKPQLPSSIRSLRAQLKQQHQQRRHQWSCFSMSSISNSSKPQNSISAVKDNLVVLGIETSCDDTAAAVVRGDGEILSQVVSSQADLLVRYGGVAPKMAEEAHSQVIDQVVQQALEIANLCETDLSAVAVTIGPGLSLCLGVGVRKARKIAGRFNLPIVGIHHMEAHALVARLVERDLQFPFLVLLISASTFNCYSVFSPSIYFSMSTSVTTPNNSAPLATAVEASHLSGAPAIKPSYASAASIKPVLEKFATDFRLQLLSHGQVPVVTSEHFDDKSVLDASLSNEVLRETSKEVEDGKFVEEAVHEDDLIREDQLVLYGRLSKGDVRNMEEHDELDKGFLTDFEVGVNMKRMLGMMYSSS